MRRIILIFFCGLVLCPPAGWAWYPRTLAESLLPGNREGAVVGENGFYLVGKGETLIEIARRGRLGYQALVNANPGVDPWQPELSTEILLPYAAILPETLVPGITINLAEYRLYLVWEENGATRVRIYPVGLGRQGWMTPEGDFHVTTIIDNPVWTAPSAIREEHPEQPVVIPPGPENPLGTHWIGLSVKGVGIHGTNRPYGIGRQVSHGCIRLYPDDIVDLVGRVEKGTPVRITYEPIKLAFRQGRLWLEAHTDYLERTLDPLREVYRRAKALGWQGTLDKTALDKVIREARGIPFPIAGIQ